MTQTPPTIDFSSFVASLAATASAHLSEAGAVLAPATAGDAEASTTESSEPEPTGQADQVRTALATSRHLIDTLGMLEDKTKGNLTTEEGQLLQTVLTQLRIAYVQVSDQAAR